MKNILGCSLLVLFASGCAVTSYSVRTPDQTAVTDFYGGDIDSAINRLEALAQKKNKDYALWKNQLGSAYLAKGDSEKALGAFLDAFYLMNNVTAFKELERGATSLVGAESNKAYKGDPYEKMYNSFYTGLLLLRKGDLENARAAFKNSILSDSDSEGDQYKSDEPLLYLFNSRVERLLGNDSLSDDLFKQAVDAFLKSSPLTQDVFEPEMAYVGQDPTVAEGPLKNFIKRDYNVFIIIESGKGPVKGRSGQYGEKAFFWGEDTTIQEVGINIDGQNVSEKPLVADVYYQATTRGGRKMDSILKGKAQFKDDAAQTANTMLEASNNMLQQGNQVRASNPYADTTGYAAAAGIMAFISMGSAIMSVATNPAADIRHWSLMPNKMWVYCIKLPPGSHKIEIVSHDGPVMSAMTSGEINVKSIDDSINFFRLFPNRGLPENNDGKSPSFVYMAAYDDEVSANAGREGCIKDSVLYSATTVDVHTLMDENLRNKAASLISMACSDIVRGSDGKYYMFRKGY